jgi:hypothetical protein
MRSATKSAVAQSVRSFLYSWIEGGQCWIGEKGKMGERGYTLTGRVAVIQLQSTMAGGR